MDRISIAEAVITAVREFAANKDAVRRDAELVALGVDSLDNLALIAVLEDVCGVTISCAERVCAETVGDLVDLIARLASPLRLAA